MTPMTPMTPMEPMKPMSPMEPLQRAEAWWPKQLGEPAATGGSNDLDYAYFPDAGRLAVREKGGQARVYDTAGRRLHGFSSSSGRALRFHTDDGEAGLDSLEPA